jgi:hypothetical protein
VPTNVPPAPIVAVTTVDESVRSVPENWSLRVIWGCVENEAPAAVPADCLDSVIDDNAPPGVTADEADEVAPFPLPFLGVNLKM